MGTGNRALSVPASSQAPPANAHAILQVVEAIDLDPRDRTLEEQNQFLRQLIRAKRLDHPNAAATGYANPLDRRHTEKTLRASLGHFASTHRVSKLQHESRDEAISELFRQGSVILTPEFLARIRSARQVTPPLTGYTPDNTPPMPIPGTAPIAATTSAAAATAIPNAKGSEVIKGGRDGDRGSATGSEQPVDATTSRRRSARGLSKARDGSETREAKDHVPSKRSTRSNPSTVDLTGKSKPKQDRPPRNLPAIAEESPEPPQDSQQVRRGTKGKGRARDHDSSARPAPPSKKNAPPPPARNTVPASASVALADNAEPPPDGPPRNVEDVLSMDIGETITYIHDKITAATEAFFTDQKDQNAMCHPTTHPPPNLETLYFKVLCRGNDEDWRYNAVELHSLNVLHPKPFLKALIWTSLRLNIFDKKELSWEGSSLQIPAEMAVHLRASLVEHEVSFDDVARRASFIQMQDAGFRGDVLKKLSDRQAFDLMITLCAHIEQINQDLVTPAAWMALLASLKKICGDALLLDGRLRSLEEEYAVRAWARIPFSPVHMVLDPDCALSGNTVAFTTRPALVLVRDDEAVSEGLVMLLPGEDGEEEEEEEVLVVNGGKEGAGEPAAPKGSAGDEPEKRQEAPGRSVGEMNADQQEVRAVTENEPNSEDNEVPEATDGDGNAGDGEVAGGGDIEDAPEDDGKEKQVKSTPRMSGISEPLSSAKDGSSLVRMTEGKTSKSALQFFKSPGTSSPPVFGDKDTPTLNTKHDSKRSGSVQESTTSKRQRTSKSLRTGKPSVSDADAVDDQGDEDDENVVPAAGKRKASTGEKAAGNGGVDDEDAANDPEDDDDDEVTVTAVGKRKRSSVVDVASDDKGDDEEEEIPMPPARKPTRNYVTDLSSALTAFQGTSQPKTRDPPAARKQSIPKQALNPGDARGALKRMSTLRDPRNVKRRKTVPKKEPVLEAFETWDGVPSEEEDFDEESDGVEGSEVVEDMENVEEKEESEIPEASDEEDENA